MHTMQVFSRRWEQPRFASPEFSLTPWLLWESGKHSLEEAAVAALGTAAPSAPYLTHVAPRGLWRATENGDWVCPEPECGSRFITVWVHYSHTGFKRVCLGLHHPKAVVNLCMRCVRSLVGLIHIFTWKLGVTAVGDTKDSIRIFYFSWGKTGRYGKKPRYFKSIVSNVLM